MDASLSLSEQESDYVITLTIPKSHSNYEELFEEFNLLPDEKKRKALVRIFDFVTKEL